MMANNDTQAELRRQWQREAEITPEQRQRIEAAVFRPQRRIPWGVLGLTAAAAGLLLAVAGQPLRSTSSTTSTKPQKVHPAGSDDTPKRAQARNKEPSPGYTGEADAVVRWLRGPQPEAELQRALPPQERAVSVWLAQAMTTAKANPAPDGGQAHSVDPLEPQHR